jgi:hypothetical protein
MRACSRGCVLANLGRPPSLAPGPLQAKDDWTLPRLIRCEANRSAADFRLLPACVTQNFVAADCLIVTVLLPLGVIPVTTERFDEIDVAGAVKSPGVVVGIADAC